MLKTILSPLLLSFVLLFAGLGLTFRRWKKLQKAERCSSVVFGAGTIILFIYSMPFVASNMAGCLEYDYLSYSQSAIKQLDVIVVLAGGLNRGQDVIQDELTGLTYSRTVAGIRAFKSSNARIIVMSGGARDIKNTSMVDAMRSLAIEMGVPVDKIRVDPLSRNTFEHPVMVLDLPGINKIDRIGVATSAWHLPRAMTEFRRYFSNAAAIPCDYSGFGSTNGWLNFIPSAGALEKSTTIIHEFIGGYWYRVRHACEWN
jgi:uncharacterized SAM-binding protein YcdF (DUF218 family)